MIDLQYDFCPGGRLAVERGGTVIPVINRIATGFAHVVLTQDWHMQGHLSFASSHPGKEPFSEIALPYGPQTLWPDHCVQGTPGADFHKGLEIGHAELVIRKGFRRDIDSYSAFYENDHATGTGLAGYLRERGFERVFCAGLATDYSVWFSAEDARQLGFETVVIEGGYRAIDLDGSLDAAGKAMAEAGVELLYDLGVAPRR